MIVDDFIKHVTEEKKGSLYTARCYRSDLDQFCGFLVSVGRDHAIDGSTRETIVEWWAWLSGKPYSPVSRLRKVATLRAFFRWACSTGRITRDPIFGWKVTPDPTPGTIGDAQAQRPYW